MDINKKSRVTRCAAFPSIFTLVVMARVNISWAASPCLFVFFPSVFGKEIVERERDKEKNCAERKAWRNEEKERRTNRTPSWNFNRAWNKSHLSFITYTFLYTGSIAFVKDILIRLSRSTSLNFHRTSAKSPNVCERFFNDFLKLHNSHFVAFLIRFYDPRTGSFFGKKRTFQYVVNILKNGGSFDNTIKTYYSMQTSSVSR